MKSTIGFTWPPRRYPPPATGRPRLKWRPSLRAAPPRTRTPQRPPRTARLCSPHLQDCGEDCGEDRGGDCGEDCDEVSGDDCGLRLWPQIVVRIAGRLTAGALRFDLRRHFERRCFLLARRVFAVPLVDQRTCIEHADW